MASSSSCGKNGRLHEADAVDALFAAKDVLWLLLGENVGCWELLSSIVKQMVVSISIHVCEDKDRC